MGALEAAADGADLGNAALTHFVLIALGVLIAVLTVVNLIAEGIFQPVEGLAIALVAIHLLELHGEAPAPDEMARSLVGEHE